MNSKTINGHTYQYLFDLKDRRHTETYFKFKQKYGHTFCALEERRFLIDVTDALNAQAPWQTAHTVITPETGNVLLQALLRHCGKTVITLKKNSIDDIKRSLQLQTLMKSEREKLYSALDSQTTIKMAHVAGNQRKRLVNCLFQDIAPESYGFDCDNHVFLDDSLFSGYT